VLGFDIGIGIGIGIGLDSGSLAVCVYEGQIYDIRVLYGVCLSSPCHKAWVVV
jgi:hypothetical protein